MKEKTIETMVQDSLDSGSYFFDDDTMHFWNSRIKSELIEEEYFITSEDNYDRSRILFSICRYDWENHEVTTISWQKHKTLEEAREALQEFLAEGADESCS